MKAWLNFIPTCSKQLDYSLFTNTIGGVIERVYSFAIWWELDSLSLSGVIDF